MKILERIKKIRRRKSEITKDNHQELLNDIGRSITSLFVQYKPDKLEGLLEHEMQNWLDNTIFRGENLDLLSFRAGCCFASFVIAQELSKTGKKDYVV